MAKKELIRKVLATVLTVLGLACGLALCLWLLLGSDEFGSQLRWLMIVCTGVLAVAIVGLLVCKVQEIKALAEIVQYDKERAQQAAAGRADGPAAAAPDAAQAEPVAQAEPAAPVMAAVPAADGTDAEAELPGIAVEMPAAHPQEEEPRHHWKPINFKAVDRQAQADDAARRQALEQAASPAASAAVPAAPSQSQPPAMPAADPSLVQQARRMEAQRRSEQLHLAQEARLGRVRADQVAAAEQARLAELARKAEAERIAQRSAGLSTAPAVPAAAPAQPAAPAASPGDTGWVKAAGTAPAPARQASEAAAAPEPEAGEQETHKLHVKPIQWPAPPPPSKLYVTGQIPAVTDEMIAQARQEAQARQPEDAGEAAGDAGSQPWHKSS